MTATLLRTTRFCFARLSMLLICLLRCSTSANHSALSKFDGILHETCHSANHYIHNLSESQWVQASLPVRNGSLGIRRVSMWPLRQAPCHWSPTSCPIVLLQIAVVCSHTCCLGGSVWRCPSGPAVSEQPFCLWNWKSATMPIYEYGIGVRIRTQDNGCCCIAAPLFTYAVIRCTAGGRARGHEVRDGTGRYMDC